MSKPHREDDGLFYFIEGFILKNGIPGEDTVTIRVSNIRDAWNEILASPVMILSPPEKGRGYTTALFKLPGGQTILLKE